MATIKNNAANAATENTVKTEGTENVQVSNPMMKQFKQLKEKRPDALLLFRCGDFYECYEDDAKAVAEVCGITLTKAADTTMAGFPHHALDSYLPMLVRAGKRVAICDQITPSNSPRGEQKTNANANANVNANPNGNANATKAEKPKSETKDDAPKAEPETKTEKPKVTLKRKVTLKTKKAIATLTYETYTNKKGKTCARIKGFSEDDARYLQGPELHGSKTWERDKKGNKTYMLVFGPVYVDAAKQLCEAWNNGDAAAISKAVEAVNGTLDAHRKEREAQRAEYKAKAEERKAKRENTAATDCYTKEDVAAMLQKVMAGEDIPEDIKQLLQKAA